MLSSLFAEDVFLEFYSKVDARHIIVQHQDFLPIQSFYDKISAGSSLTKNQANYIIKLLEKYKNLSVASGLDYRNILQNLKWKNQFRVLDLSKKIYVEKNKNGRLEVCLKFPYQLKKEFDEEITPLSQSISRSGLWDPEEKVRRLNLYDYNLISLYEFANRHNFEIDDSFMSVLSDVEEIWQNSEEIVPYCEVTAAGIKLFNASSEILEWWESKRSGVVKNDLLLAKSMGFNLRKIPENTIEKISNSVENTFWIKNNKTLFDLSFDIFGKICIILDRTSDTLQWLQKFVHDADNEGVTRDEIKVCFRDSKEKNSGLNEWIKLAGVGGKVDNGKYLIFENKPAKWLFKEEHDVKILVTNNIYPLTNTLTRDWFNSHSFVIYLGETKPTEQKGQKIVEL